MDSGLRIIGFYELCALPEGAIFSCWEPCIATGLYRRGEVIYSDGKPIDFFQLSLIADCTEDGEPEMVNAEGRWGLFNYEQQFLLYDRQSLTAMAAYLTAAVLPAE